MTDALATFTPGPRLALAVDAVNERIADDPSTVDWFGVACAISEAHVSDLRDRGELPPPRGESPL